MNGFNRCCGSGSAQIGIILLDPESNRHPDDVDPDPADPDRHQFGSATCCPFRHNLCVIFANSYFLLVQFIVESIHIF